MSQDVKFMAASGSGVWSRFGLPSSAAVAVLLNGCSLLLGPDQPTEAGFNAPLWDVQTVIEGDISGLDMALIPDVGLIASYVVDGTSLRVSRYAGGVWENMTGPEFGPTDGVGGEIGTHVAVGPSGETAVLFGTSTRTMVLPVTTSPGVPFDLADLQVSLRSPSYAQPAGYTVESGSLAYDSDGRLRILARDTGFDRLWLFRQEADGWSLGPVPFSEGVLGPAEIAVYGTTNEHVVFQAGSQGYYFWWRPDDGWVERLRFVAGLPFLLRLRDNQASVLALRSGNTLRVAEERRDPQSGDYFWEVRSVVEDANLYWHNYQLALDPAGFPSHVYILGQLPNETFEVWITRLALDGTWDRARVSGNLKLPAFNPFNVRMVREPGGRYHVLLTAGQSSSRVGGDTQVRQFLLHLESDSPFGR